MLKNSTSWHLGVLPSLETLPLFADVSEEEIPAWDGIFQIKAHASYGEIARHLLMRKLVAAVIPWEIFVADVLALPGQRNQWTVALFISACPTELVLRPPIHRVFYPSQALGRVRLPSRLVVGVQNQNSLTKAQFQSWLGHWKGSGGIEVIYKMLPMDLRIRALEAEAVDATIAPSPWGIYAESRGLGACDTRFAPGKFAQKVALVCRKDLFEDGLTEAVPFLEMMASAKRCLLRPGGMAKAVEKMIACGKPQLGLEAFEKAASLHGFESLPPAVAPDAQHLMLALARLAEQAILPAQVAVGEQTARLLVR